MLIAACGELLSCEAAGIRITPPEDTPLGALAITVRGMARAYADDGATFLKGGDMVNALAAFYYGHGWLHFGVHYGLLSAEKKLVCPFVGPVETLPSSLADRLDEKTRRYDRLLTTACQSVVMAPDPETSGGMFARRVIAISTCYSQAGKNHLAAGAEEEALSCFSYGHGWLDAGVRSGLFALTGNRELFTI